MTQSSFDSYNQFLEDGNLDRFTKILSRYDFFKMITELPGDIVECGVGHGHSLFKLCCLSIYENKNRSIYGFDSFEGFPEPTSEDISHRKPKKGEWKIANPSEIKEFLLNEGHLDKSFINSNVKLIKGFFKSTLPKYQGDKIALLHLDVDLYQSYKETLEYFWPKVANKGVVLFDEYKQEDSLYKFPGAAEAIDEYFGSLSLVNNIQYNKQANRYYIIKNE